MANIVKEEKAERRIRSNEWGDEKVQLRKMGRLVASEGIHEEGSIWRKTGKEFSVSEDKGAPEMMSRIKIPFLDILPNHKDKGKSIEYLQERNTHK